MVASQLALAINTAPTLPAFREARSAMWSAWSLGRITQDEADQLEAAAELRERALKGQSAPWEPKRAAVRVGAFGKPGPTPKTLARVRSRFSTGKRPPTSPDRERSHLRCVDQIRSNPLPRTLMCSTLKAIAVMAVIADEIVKRGQCALTHGEIATRAGVSVSTVKRAVAWAVGRGVASVTVRPRRLAPNLPNVIRALCGEWKEWLAGRRAALAAKERDSKARRAARAAEARGEVLEGGRGSKRSAPFNHNALKGRAKVIRGAEGAPSGPIEGHDPPPGRLRPA